MALLGMGALSTAVASLTQGVAMANSSAQATKIGAVFWSNPEAKNGPGAALVRWVSDVNSLSANYPSRMHRASGGGVFVRAVAMQDSLADAESDGIGEFASGQRMLKDHPPGLQCYETMAVLRPDVSEEQRLALTQRYEELIIAGGGLDVEMFHRGMQPLAYNIKTKNMSGVSSRYLDGIYLLFTYVTKPESQQALQKRLNADDDIIRATTFRLKV